MAVAAIQAPQISDIEAMSNSDLETMLQVVARVLVRRKVAVLPARETDLLRAIEQQPFSPDERRRFDFLNEKLRQEKISKTEHETLLLLLSKMEKHNVQRLKNLIELSQIRRVSLDELMHQLGIEAVSQYG